MNQCPRGHRPATIRLRPNKCPLKLKIQTEYSKTEPIPRSKTLYLRYKKQSFNVQKIVAVCSETQPKHRNTFCAENVQFLSFKTGDTHSNHQSLKG